MTPAGWKKVSVGSDGTDVLVKAMVNIMLINVFKERVSGRFTDFRIPHGVIVVGVENMENFRLPERQRDLLAQIGRREDDNRPSARLLLVSRYPQSKDLATWLQEIPNPYVHFGDFDLAGIHIYLSCKLWPPLNCQIF